MMPVAIKRWLPTTRGVVTALPYFWLLLFFAIPFLIVARISFTAAATAMPPYTAIASFNDSVLQLRMNLGNYLALFGDNQYLLAYLSSIKIAVIATALTLLVGYPMAYVIARQSAATRSVLMMLVILPSWTSFLIRVYAWIGILDSQGILNRTLISLGLIDGPLQILYTPTAAYIGLVYCYLPFMVLPLYANLVKHDNRLLEAAYDLGAKPWQAFLRITLPLSRAGVVAGSMLVAIPIVGEFVIPEMLGGPDTLMIGRVLWSEFFSNRDWPMASAVAIIMLLLLLIPILIFNRAQQKELEGRLS